MKKRPSRWSAIFQLAKMFHRGGMNYAVAIAISDNKILWDYDNWSKEDDKWFWDNLQNDKQALKGYK